MAKSDKNRSIYYYDFYVLCQNNETKKYIKDKESKLIIEFFTTLYEKQQHSVNYKEFLLPTGNGDDFYIIVDTINSNFIEFRIVLCRKDALPFIEKDGKLETLTNYIDSDQNIAEITHAVFFNEYGVMGAEYNFSGARPSAVAEYMRRSEINWADIITCRAKLNYDAYSKLISGEEFSLFEFGVKSNSSAYNELLSKKTIFSSIQKTTPDVDVFEIILKKRKTKKNKNKGFDLPLTLEETKQLIGKYREDITKFHVSQGTYKDSIDLLSDKLVTKIIPAKTNERTIDASSLYKGIKNYIDIVVKDFCK